MAQSFVFSEVSVRDNIDDVIRFLNAAEMRVVPTAIAKSLTFTAERVQEEERSVMRAVFDRPTPYTINSLWKKTATATHLVASVEFKDGGGKGLPAKRYLNPEVHGGMRSLKSSERRLTPFMRGYSAVVPSTSAPLDAYGNIKGSVYTQILSQLRISEAGQNAPRNKKGKRSSRRTEYFVPANNSGLKAGVYRRKPQGGIEPVLIFVKTPSYKKRFPFYETGDRVVKEQFPPIFLRVLEKELSRLRPP